LLQELLPSAVVDICFPADPGANLPSGEALEGYDGVAITGSGLHVYEPSPAVTNQIELTRAALKSGTPVFGSCWGLQVLTVAAGGVVRKNPKGREIGFGRRIKLTEPGRKHPMYVGKPEVFDAVTVHLDRGVELGGHGIPLAELETEIGALERIVPQRRAKRQTEERAQYDRKTRTHRRTPKRGGWIRAAHRLPQPGGGWSRGDHGCG
jgi:GMP synthase-like glutamine amidotransferase